ADQLGNQPALAGADRTDDASGDPAILGDRGLERGGELDQLRDPADEPPAAREQRAIALVEAARADDLEHARPAAAEAAPRRHFAQREVRARQSAGGAREQRPVGLGVAREAGGLVDRVLTDARSSVVAGRDRDPGA